MLKSFGKRGEQMLNPPMHGVVIFVVAVVAVIDVIEGDATSVGISCVTVV